MGYDRVEQIWEGVLGDGLEGNFWEEGLPSCIQMKFECLNGFSGHNFLCQFVLVWDDSNAERMLTTTGLIPLLVNLESMTPKPNAGGGSKDCVTSKVEAILHYFLHVDNAPTDSSAG